MLPLASTVVVDRALMSWRCLSPGRTPQATSHGSANQRRKAALGLRGRCVQRRFQFANPTTRSPARTRTPTTATATAPTRRASSAQTVRSGAWNPSVGIGAYRVFGCNGSTTVDVMIAAMERAQADGMHVLNMSIGRPADRICRAQLECNRLILVFLGRRDHCRQEELRRARWAVRGEAVGAQGIGRFVQREPLGALGLAGHHCRASVTPL